jgi:hypothetical protein
MRPAHARLLGESGQGGGLSGGGPVVALRGQGRGLGGSQGQLCGLLPPGEAVRACGRQDGVGVTRHKLHSASEYSMSGRIRTRSVQPSALRSAQGRTCVHRGALSPEHAR